MANIYDVNAAIDKPNLLGSALAGVGFGNQQRQLREQRADEATLRGLAPGIMGGDTAAFEQAAAIDPARAAGLQKAGNAKWETLIGGVQMVKRAAASGNPEAAQNAWAAFRPYIQKVTGTTPPESFAEAAPHFATLEAKLASIQGGTAEQKPDYDRYRNVGGALIDLAGDPTKPIFTAPDDPVNAQIVKIPDGNGGFYDMIFDPQTRQLSDLPTPGGMPAPTTGAGPKVMDGALQDAQGGQPFFDDVQAAIAPFGGILGSTTGGQHNVGSLHYGGNAVDIPMGASASPEAKANAAQMIAALEARGYRVRDERERPAGQAVWSGPHLHAERVGGAGPQTGRLGYTPPKTGAQWQPMTPEEVAAVGLPPGTVAQRNVESGQVQTIRLPSNAATSGGKPLPQGTVDKLTKDAAKLANLSELAGGFNDAYAGNKVGGSLENFVGRMGGEAFGIATPGQASWWQQYDRYKNEIRNELFGASLTAGEQAAFEAADITPNMAPAVIRQNMAKQAQVIQSALQRKANTWAAQGYNREAIEAATGLTPAGAAASNADDDALINKYLSP